MELILTGNNIKAQEAYRIGLVNKVVRLARSSVRPSAGPKSCDDGGVAMASIIRSINEAWHELGRWGQE